MHNKKNKYLSLNLIILLMAILFHSEEASAVYLIPFFKNKKITGVPFITKWKTTNPGISGLKQISLPLTSTGKYYFKVDWGDGKKSIIKKWNAIEKTHTYINPGMYTVTMTGSFSALFFHGGGDAEKLLEINQWGSNKWATMFFAFSGCSNLNFKSNNVAAIDPTLIDAPDLSNVSEISYMFSNASLFNSSVGHWNTSNIKKMRGVFAIATSFNKDIGSWDTSKTDDMTLMFAGAKSFNNLNRPLRTQSNGRWNISKVTSLRWMFFGAQSFNQDITNWDTSNVVTMVFMFVDANVFNQNIGSWNTAKVEDMMGMFASTRVFNQNIGSWNTSKVNNMSAMFLGASSFNQNLSSWSVANVHSNHIDFDKYASLWSLPRPNFIP